MEKSVGRVPIVEADLLGWMEWTSMKPVRQAARDPATTIWDFHANIYFNPNEVDQARTLAEVIGHTFDVSVGSLHVRPIGPHPRGSCQVTISIHKFGEVAQWLSINRGALTVFVHPSTGDDRADHLDYSIWFGASETLVRPAGFA